MARKVTKSTGNIFLDLGFPPHEAEVMLVRAKLAEALHKWIERESRTQAQASKRFGYRSIFSRCGCNRDISCPAGPN